MRRYDDPVEVRRGLGDGPGPGQGEGPEQFVWRGRLWVVREVLAHWVETGAWWEQPCARQLLGTDTPAEPGPATDLLAEQEVWRVQAARGQSGRRGIFDLSFDWADGQWRLVRAID